MLSGTDIFVELLLQSIGAKRNVIVNIYNFICNSLYKVKFTSSKATLLLKKVVKEASLCHELVTPLILIIIVTKKLDTKTLQV